MTNASKRPVCRLCHASSELCISHVFPRSFIKLVRDEDSKRFYEIHDRADTLIQDGPKERLLCGDCEQRISQHEKYFKEAVHLSRHGIEIFQADGEAVIRSLHYGNTKLFLLSILWRMSVSSLPQCQAVTLGEKGECLRRVLLRGDPGGSLEFPISAAILLINGRMEESVLCTPFASKRNDAYALIIGGILYFVSIAHGHVFLGRRYLLNESGDCIMPLVEFDEVPFLEEFLKHNFGGESYVSESSCM